MDSEHQPPNPVMWIKEGSGVGKSTIAVYLIDVLMELFPVSIVCYFFCKRKTEELMMANDIVRVFVYQCIEAREARSSLEALRRSGFRTDDKVGISLLFKWLLKEPLQLSRKEVIILLDGLDEIDDSIQDEIEGRSQIKILLERCRIIVLSRPDAVLQIILPTTVVKSLGPNDNDEDIRLYIETEIKTLKSFQEHFATLHKDPIDYLVKEVNGVFLWIFLVLQ